MRYKYTTGELLPKPKPTITATIYLASVALLLTSMCLCARAQEDIEWTPAASGQSALTAKGLHVGDGIPGELWNMPLTLWKAADNSTKTITLNDYRGKVIILDFWATWCSACLYYMPHQFALQEQFGGDLVTLPVTYEKAEYVGEFIRNSSYERLKAIKPIFRTIAENKSLLEHFPLNTSLPLIVVITPDGKVDAVTTPMLLTEEYVAGAIAGTERYAPLKRGAIEQLPPLLEYSLSDVKQYKPVYYTSISGEIDGAESIGAVDTLNGAVRTLMANSTILGLYALGRYADTSRSFGFAGPGTHHRRVLEVADPSIYGHYQEEGVGRRTVFNPEWRRANRYTYESVLPLHTKQHSKKQVVDDLNRFFGLEGRIERRKVPLYVLTKNRNYKPQALDGRGKMAIVHNGWQKSRIAKDKQIGVNERGYLSYVKNMPMELISAQISLMFDRIANTTENPMPMVIDETGIDPKIPIDLGFSTRPQAARTELINNLRKQGFELKLEVREIPMFVLTEPGYEAAPGEKLVMTKYGYIPESNLKYLPFHKN